MWSMSCPMVELTGCEGQIGSSSKNEFTRTTTDIHTTGKTRTQSPNQTSLRKPARKHVNPK